MEKTSREIVEQKAREFMETRASDYAQGRFEKYMDLLRAGFSMGTQEVKDAIIEYASCVNTLNIIGFVCEKIYNGVTGDEEQEANPRNYIHRVRMTSSETLALCDKDLFKP